MGKHQDCGAIIAPSLERNKLLDSERFQRTELFIGPEGMQKLTQAHVTIVGLGAVGSYALEAIARLGVGHLRLVDFDVVKPSNFNRQLLAIEPNLDRKKIDVARERVLSINPNCRVETFERFMAEDTFGEVFASPTDIVVDAVDSLNAKVNFLVELHKHKLPVVSSMGAGWKQDPMLIRSRDISHTEMCPLACRIRRRLRKRGIQSGVQCIFSLEAPHTPKTEIPEEPNFLPRGRDRKPLGSLSFLTGMFGLWVAREVFTHLISGQFSTGLQKTQE